MSVGRLSDTRRYYVQKFTSSGTFSLPGGFGAGNPLPVEALLVGGGGGAAGAYGPTISTIVFGGGGGGGGVRNDILSLTADAPIIVGRGGAPGQNADVWNGNAGNGMFSAVNATVKNLWINPQCLRQSPAATVGQFFGTEWAPSSGTFTPSNTGGSQSGGSIVFGNLATLRSRPYRLTAGTQYTFSCYSKATTTNQTLTITANYFLASSKASAAVSSTSSSALALTSGTYVRTSLTFTVAANTDMVQFALVGGGTSNTITVSNFMLEAASSASTYADGDTSGCAWVGPRDGSETVATGTYAAVAGGGGGGLAKEFAQNPASGNVWGGFPGATSGGGGSPVATTSYVHNHGGCGGGAGGHATWTKLFYTTSATSLSAVLGSASGIAPMGMGAPGFGGTTGGGQSNEKGQPGPGIDEYGKGGHGSMFAGATSLTTQIFDGLVPANSGQGGSGTLTALTIPNTAEQYGNPGADGIVILRYWA